MCVQSIDIGNTSKTYHEHAHLPVLQHSTGLEEEDIFESNNDGYLGAQEEAELGNGDDGVDSTPGDSSIPSSGVDENGEPLSSQQDSIFASVSMGAAVVVGEAANSSCDR